MDADSFIENFNIRSIPVIVLFSNSMSSILVAVRGPSQNHIILLWFTYYLARAIYSLEPGLGKVVVFLSEHSHKILTIQQGEPCYLGILCSPCSDPERCQAGRTMLMLAKDFQRNLLPEASLVVSSKFYESELCLYMCYLSIHYPETDNCRLISLIISTGMHKILLNRTNWGRSTHELPANWDKWHGMTHFCVKCVEDR